MHLLCETVVGFEYSLEVEIDLKEMTPREICNLAGHNRSVAHSCIQELRARGVLEQYLSYLQRKGINTRRACYQ